MRRLHKRYSRMMSSIVADAGHAHVATAPPLGASPFHYFIRVAHFLRPQIVILPPGHSRAAYSSDDIDITPFDKKIYWSGFDGRIRHTTDTAASRSSGPNPGRLYIFVKSRHRHQCWKLLIVP